MIEGVIIDAGHGGIDSGAVGNNLLEKDLNLEATLYLYDRLKELGIPTKLVRDSDEYLPKEERVRRIKNLKNLTNMQLVFIAVTCTYLISAFWGNTMYYTVPYFWMALALI